MTNVMCIANIFKMLWKNLFKMFNKRFTIIEIERKISFLLLNYITYSLFIQ